VGSEDAVSEERPAFYALAPGGWRDWWTLLHPPYTIWHLSYVALGASTVAEVDLYRLGMSLLGFFLGVGLAAHALDELRGRPLGTSIPDRVLQGVAIVALGSAAAVGVIGIVQVSAWLALFIAVGAFLVIAYNLELLGGSFHSDLWFALAWGAFPLLTAYVGAAETVRPEALLAAAFAAFLSLAQRYLSTQVRTIRRRSETVSGTITFGDGREEPITQESLIRVPEATLRALTWAVVALALALLALRVT
jgi:hypothetical protein